MSESTPSAPRQPIVTLVTLGVAAFAIYGWQKADQRAFNAIAISGNGAIMQKVVQAVSQVDKAVGNLNQRVKALEAPQLGLSPTPLTSTNPAPTNAPATNAPAKP